MSVRILAVDPGSVVVGFSCIEITKPFFPSPQNCKVLECGVVKLPNGDSYLERLSVLRDSIEHLSDEFRPDIVALEAGYVGVNPSTSLKLGEIRGVIMSCWLGKEVPIYTYSPREVKQVVSGKGNATKEAVSAALKALVGFDAGQLPYDATDALAVALCCGLDQSAIP
jgi:crossover junction endodeoxyribonuclease RuvC